MLELRVEAAEVVAGPAGHGGGDALARRHRVARAEAQAGEDAGDVAVRRQHGAVEAREVEHGRRRLAPHARQPFQPGERVGERQVAQEAEVEVAPLRPDRGERRQQAFGLDVGEGDGGDRLLDLRRGRRGNAGRIAEALAERGKGGFGQRVGSAAADQRLDELTDGAAPYWQRRLIGPCVEQRAPAGNADGGIGREQAQRKRSPCDPTSGQRPRGVWWVRPASLWISTNSSARQPSGAIARVNGAGAP